MSKITKLLRHPDQFVADSWPVRRLVSSILVRQTGGAVDHRVPGSAPARKADAKTAVGKVTGATLDEASARKATALGRATPDKAKPIKISPDAVPAWYRPEIGTDLRRRLDQPGNISSTCRGSRSTAMR